MPCSHIDTCELFPELTVNSALKVWQVFYCECDYRQCVRYQKSKKGEAVAITLLPNGKVMDDSLLLGRKPKTQGQPAAPAGSGKVAAPAASSGTAAGASTGDAELLYYLRFQANGSAETADSAKEVLHQLGIGVDAVIDKRLEDGNRWIILMTDKATEMAIYRAVVRIEELGGVHGKVKCIGLEQVPTTVTA